MASARERRELSIGEHGAKSLSNSVKSRASFEGAVFGEVWLFFGEV